MTGKGLCRIVILKVFDPSKSGILTFTGKEFEHIHRIV